VITEHFVRGSSDTCIHNFSLHVEGMRITFSNGKYIANNSVLFESESGATIEIPSRENEAKYEIWLASEGLALLSKTESEEFGYVEDPIDRLVWFTVPANVQTLDHVEIHFVKVVDERESQTYTSHSAP
jgi:hypothetical protein